MLGRVLGRGGFGVVSEITSFKIAGVKSFKRSSSSSSSKWGSRRKNKKQLSSGDLSEASFVSAAQLSRESIASKTHRRPRYVIKRLPTDVQNKAVLVKGIVDLAMEFKFLAILDHRHISKLRGVSDGDPFDESYFLILDKVNEVLPQKIKAWGIVDRGSKGITGAITGGKKRLVELMTDRLQVAHDIASALGYMHSRNLIYRDLVRTHLCNIIFVLVCSVPTQLMLAPGCPPS